MTKLDSIDVRTEQPTRAIADFISRCGLIDTIQYTIQHTTRTQGVLVINTSSNDRTVRNKLKIKFTADMWMFVEVLLITATTSCRCGLDHIFNGISFADLAPRLRCTEESLKTLVYSLIAATV